MNLTELKMIYGKVLSNFIKSMNFTVFQSVLAWKETKFILTCPDKVDKILVECIGNLIFGVSIC